MASSVLNSDDGVISGTSGLKSVGGDDGVLQLQSNGADRLALKAAEVVVNDGGANVDFRVEGDTNANLLFVDASADSVGVGNNQPTIVDGNTNTKLTVGDTTTNDGALGVVTTARKGTSGNLAIGAFQFANTDIAGTEKRIAIVGGRTGTATNDGVIEFFTASSGTLGEVARFTQDKYLRFASGTGGIQFNGDTAAANALDDYEEGTFTPGIAFGGASVGITYAGRVGNYTKIGNTVRVFMSVELSSKGSSSGSLSFATLPFSCADAGQPFYAIFGTLTSISSQIQVYVSGSTVYVELIGSGAQSGLTNSNVQNNSTFFLSAVYRTT